METNPPVRCPHPLRNPSHHRSDPPYIDLLECVWTLLNWTRLKPHQKQDRLLNLSSQVHELHDVRHARRGDLGVEGPLRLVLDHAVTNQLLTLNCECHHARRTDTAKGNREQAIQRSC